MEFHGKLVFLMNLTQTTNKELALALSVDPSLISLFRSGKRKQPQNPDYIQSMASFFAKRCPASYQRNALSEMLNQASIGTSMPMEVLASRLSTWLAEGSEVASQLFAGVEGTSTNVPNESSDSLSNPFPKDPSIPLPHQFWKTSDTNRIPGKSLHPTNFNDLNYQFYLGAEGRREAVLEMMDVTLKAKEPGTILISSDDNLEWLLYDYSLAKQIQENMKVLLERGFTLYQIMPPINYLSRFAEALRFWLPIYSSGQVQVFYYPRLRDNLYRRSMFIFPKHCVRVSNSIGLDSSSDITLFSTNEDIIDAYQAQYMTHLSLCHPALTAHFHFREFTTLFSEVMTRNGDLINMVSFLSPCTMPPDLYSHFMKETRNQEWKEALVTLKEPIVNFENLLKAKKYIDMSYLATAEEVRAGKVPVASPPGVDSTAPVYTPETYAKHLKHILWLMDQYDYFYFVPLNKNNSENYDLFVNSDGFALLIRSVSPALILEMQRPELVIACQEYLLHKADSLGYAGIHKETTRRTLLKLIKELS